MMTRFTRSMSEKVIDAGIALSCLCDMFWLDSTVVFVLSAWGCPGTFQNRSLMSVCEKMWHPLSIHDAFLSRTPTQNSMTISSIENVAGERLDFHNCVREVIFQDSAIWEHAHTNCKTTLFENASTLVKKDQLDRNAMSCLYLPHVSSNSRVRIFPNLKFSLDDFDVKAPRARIHTNSIALLLIWWF